MFISEKDWWLNLILLTLLGGCDFLSPHVDGLFAFCCYRGIQPARSIQMTS